MKRIKGLYVLVFVLAGLLTVYGCGRRGAGKDSGVETVETAEGETLVYIDVADAKASSFDQTPDWAPEPNPMAPVDGDMLTRWSSDYTSDNQWIYFDFGKQRVVSNVIVIWERACAKKYEILASNDAKNWKVVYKEDNGRPGSVEAYFTPVSCRYLQILGLERANRDWGISIWEVEIYGPASHNPGAGTTKQEYRAKGMDEGKKKEAENLIDKMASSVVPLSSNEFQKGVVYTSWMADELSMPSSDFTLADIKHTGFDTIAIMVPAYQATLESDRIFTNDKPDGDTPTEESIRHAAEVAHKLGMRVMIKPHVDPRTDEARIDIIASEAWFDSYEEFIIRYARLAEEIGAELFSVGTELESTTFEAWTHRWDRVIDRVRENYKGLLTYSANWTEYKEVPFWNKLDFVGIDAYFPVSRVRNPAPEEVLDGWKKVADEIESWLAEKGLREKGVILTEVGYPSAQGAAEQPWTASSNIEDQLEQAYCFEAMFSVLSDRPWFKGYYVWQYFPQDRWSPLGFTVKNKKAGEVIKKWLKKSDN